MYKYMKVILSAVKTYIDKIADKLDFSKITEVVDTALTEAKESGMFDGKTPIKGEDYWTEEDKTEIIQEVVGQIEIPESGDISEEHIHDWNEIENKPFSSAKEYICKNLTGDDFGNYKYDSELEAIRWTYSLSDDEYQLLLDNVEIKPLYYKNNDYLRSMKNNLSI